MTALDLGTATRTLTPPTSAFTSIPFGDVNLVVDGGGSIATVPYNGNRAIQGSRTGAWTLTADGPFAIDQNAALFIAVARLDDLVGSSNIFYHANGFDLGFNSTHLTYGGLGNGHHLDTTAALPTPLNLSDEVVVFGLVSNSTEGRILNTLDGTLFSEAAPMSASPSGLVECYWDEDYLLLGMWMFEGVTVSETDAIDTMAAIKVMASGTPSVSATGTGGWGVTGAGSVTVGNFDGDPEIVVPDAGGTQEPPEDPTFEIPSDVTPVPIRHVWETLAAPTLNSRGLPDSEWTDASRGGDEYAHMQIIVEGVDVTYYKSRATPQPEWANAEPFGDQTAVLTFPQVTHFQALPTWARNGANVKIKLVPVAGSALSATKTLFQGFVDRVSHAADDGPLVLEVSGSLYSADMQLRKPVFTTAPKDIGTLIPQVLNGVTGRRYKSTPKVVTGIKTAVSGGWERNLTGFVQDILATAIKGGRQYTITCEDRQPALVKKDLTTIAWAVRYGQRGISIDLGSDAQESTNALYGEGINSDGGRWRNAKYPNWKPDDTPDYPFTNPINTIYVGVRDSDTDTGNGVSVWQKKVGQPVTGVFSQSDRTALMRLQEDAGITVDGYLGPQSWASTFDTGANTGTLDGAFIAPLASARKVRPRKLGPDGDDLGANPYYDEDVLRAERYINYGAGVSKGEAIRNAKEIVARDAAPGYEGTITFNGIDPQAMSRYEIRAGQNAWVRGFHGEDVKVHIVHVDVSGDTVTVQVDTKARDYPTLAAVKRRNREATDPAREAVQRLLKGRVSTDRPTYDAESPAGRMPRHAIFSGLWDVRRIPMGSYGTVVRTEFTTSSSAQPFALAVFGKEVTAADLVSAVGNPLTATDNPWQSDAVDDLGLLQAWGWTSQPAGYYPKTYSDPNGETGNTVTGRLVDDASWEYASASSPWLWVATFAPTACYVEGRFYGGAD